MIVQIVIGRHVKKIQYLVQHFPVLPGNANLGIKFACGYGIP